MNIMQKIIIFIQMLSLWVCQDSTADIFSDLLKNKDNLEQQLLKSMLKQAIEYDLKNTNSLYNLQNMFQSIDPTLDNNQFKNFLEQNINDFKAGRSDLKQTSQKLYEQLYQNKQPQTQEYENMIGKIKQYFKSDQYKNNHSQGSIVNDSTSIIKDFMNNEDAQQMVDEIKQKIQQDQLRSNRNRANKLPYWATNHNDQQDDENQPGANNSLIKIGIFIIICLIGYICYQRQNQKQYQKFNQSERPSQIQFQNRYQQSSLEISQQV